MSSAIRNIFSYFTNFKQKQHFYLVLHVDIKYFSFFKFQRSIISFKKMVITLIFRHAEQQNKIDHAKAHLGFSITVFVSSKCSYI